MRTTALTEVFVPGHDDVEDLDGPTRAASVKIKTANRALPHYAPRGGIVSAATGPVAVTQANAALNPGTGNFTMGMWAKLAFVTGGNRLFGNGNLTLRLDANRPFFSLPVGGNHYPTVNTNFADNVWAFLAWTFNRGTGTVTCFANGAQYATIDISDNAGQAFGNTTNASVWGANWDLTSPTAGTFGECWFVSGLLTATQIADIYRTGSIAHHCAYTLNATTGQYVPAIGGLSFLQWLDFAQGYGPIIRDRSGNNQHAIMGASGLTHAVQRNPPGVPARAPCTALRMFELIQLSSLLGSQNPGAGPFTLWSDVTIPSLTSGNAAFFGGIGAGRSLGGMQTAYGFTLSANTAQDGEVCAALWDTSTQYRKLQWLSPNFRGLFADDRMVIVATRSSAGAIKIFFGYKGDFFDVTNLFTEITSGGSPPAWTVTLLGTYLAAGRHGSTTCHKGEIYDLRMANVAMTEAQLRAEYQSGEPSPSWQWGTSAALYTSDFSAGTDSWATVSSSTLTGNVDGINGSNDWLQNTRTAAGNGRMDIQRSFGSTLVLGKAYRFQATIYNPPGSVVDGVQFEMGSGVQNVSGILSIPANAETVVTAEAILTDISNPRLDFTAGGTTAGVTNGSTVYIKNYTITPIGWAVRAKFDGSGLTRLDDSTNKLDLFIDRPSSAAGLITTPDSRVAIVRARTNTNGNQQLIGFDAIDTNRKWRIRSWTITSSGTPTVSCGSASGGAQYVNAKVLVSGQNEVTDAQFVTRVAGGAQLWCNSNSTATLDHVVILDLAE